MCTLTPEVQCRLFHRNHVIRRTKITKFSRNGNDSKQPYFVMILYAWMCLKPRSLLFYFQVYDYKEARSGKSCYVRVTARLLADLVEYRDRIRTPLSGNPWLFLTKAGNIIQPSVSKIIASIQSRTYGIMSN